jgi:hypothetical protein
MSMLKSNVFVAACLSLSIVTSAVAQTTWTVTSNSGYTIQDQGISSNSLNFNLNGAQWSVSPSSNYIISDQGVANNVLTFTVAPPSTVISPDGSTLTAASTGSLVTSAGTWTLGSKTASGGNQILLNGSPAGTGYGVELEVNNGGKMYTLNKVKIWYVWKGTSWAALPPLNGTYVISGGSNAVDGGFGYSNTSPYVQLYPTNGGTGQQWTWNGSKLSNMKIAAGGSAGATGPFLADAGNGTATEGATGDAFNLIPVSGGYNVQDARTGNYLGIANNALAFGTAQKSVWTFSAQ